MKIKRLHMSVHRIAGATIDIDCGGGNGARVNIPSDGSGEFQMEVLAEAFEVLAEELRAMLRQKAA